VGRPGGLTLRKFSDVVTDEARSLVDLRVRKAAGEVVETFLTTGLRDLDRNGGLELGVLTLIAAATGEGKSVFKLHLARAAALAGHKVLSLDFEDPLNKTGQRDIARSTGIPAFKLSRLDFTEADNARILAAAVATEGWGTNVLCHAGLLQADQVRDALAEHPDAKLVLLDYAQALPGRNGNLEREIADLAWDLNSDAQKHSRAVVVFSQVTRAVEERGVRRFERSRPEEHPTERVGGYRPLGKADIAWASALGERAKAFWFLHREGRYGQKHQLPINDNRMEIIVAKANWGLEGTVIVGWDGARAQLFDLEKKGKP
jgi:replicative DNA helicase